MNVSNITEKHRKLASFEDTRRAISQSRIEGRDVDECLNENLSDNYLAGIVPNVGLKFILEILLVINL